MVDQPLLARGRPEAHDGPRRDRLGMPVVENAWTYNSKRVYVQNRLAGVPAATLMQIARSVIEEFDDPELEQLLEGDGFRGVDGALKNIIFAADGAKPRIVVSDALNNTIDIVEGPSGASSTIGRSLQTA